MFEWLDVDTARQLLAWLPVADHPNLAGVCALWRWLVKDQQRLWQVRLMLGRQHFSELVHLRCEHNFTYLKHFWSHCRLLLAEELSQIPCRTRHMQARMFRVRLGQRISTGTSSTWRTTFGPKMSAQLWRPLLS